MVRRRKGSVRQLCSGERRREEPFPGETDDWEEEPPTTDRRRSDASFQSARRRPQLQLPADSRRSCEDLTAFSRRPSRALNTGGGISSRGSGLTRARSCENGLNQTPFSVPPPGAVSVSPLVSAAGGERGSGGNLRRAPSVEEILDSVKELRVRRQSGGRMGREQQPPPQSPAADYQNVVLTPSTQTNASASRSSWSKAPVGGAGTSGHRRGPQQTDQSCYQNVWVGSDTAPRRPDVIYDHPASSGLRLRPSEPDQLYENVQWSGAPTYENVTLPESAPQYDVPRASRVYDSPRRAVEVVRVTEEATRSGEADSEWDEDSLDGDPTGRRDVPSPGELTGEMGKPRVFSDILQCSLLPSMLTALCAADFFLGFG